MEKNVLRRDWISILINNYAHTFYSITVGKSQRTYQIKYTRVNNKCTDFVHSTISNKLNRFIFFTHFWTGLGSIHLECSRFNFGVSSHYLKSLIKLLFENRFYYIYFIHYRRIFNYFPFYNYSIFFIRQYIGSEIHSINRYMTLMSQKQRNSENPSKRNRTGFFTNTIFDSTYESILWKWEFGLLRLRFLSLLHAKRKVRIKSFGNYPTAS